jgi:hypothetical protein
MGDWLWSWMFLHNNNLWNLLHLQLFSVHVQSITIGQFWNKKGNILNFNISHSKHLSLNIKSIISHHTYIMTNPPNVVVLNIL